MTSTSASASGPPSTLLSSLLSYEPARQLTLTLYLSGVVSLISAISDLFRPSGNSVLLRYRTSFLRNLPITSSPSSSLQPGYNSSVRQSEQSDDTEPWQTDMSGYQLRSNLCWDQKPVRRPKVI
ncbi:hypothetical protein B0H14DRAFT_2645993 [Mycena olivaceomarginata]|nr:hypothetical protein B0H14DRAFT_2645993 [Mycena olivaceomarginata]